jgi:hypothetical protein
MTRSKKVVKIVLIIVVALLVLIPSGWFVGTRFCVDRYVLSMDWETITFKDDIYTPLEEKYASEAELQQSLETMNASIGKNIGIAVPPRRSLADLVWPVWVMEYDGDRTHQKIFIRGLMDVGRVYEIKPR